MILGIDLGTTNSLVALCENGIPRVLRDKEGLSLVPSIIHWPEGRATPTVGQLAKKFRITDPEHTAYSVKRFIGRGKTDLDPKTPTTLNTSESTDENIVIKLGTRLFSAIELSAEILKKLKTIAEENLSRSVSKAVITVPAYFNDSQRTATKLAGRLAGLEVIRIVNEPTAAALAYGLDRKKNGLIAVYDLGGGTFDISILKLHDGIFEVLSTNGDTALGGDDFDHKLFEIILTKVQNQVSKAEILNLSEQIKIQLTTQSVATGLLDGKIKIEVTRKEFEKSIEPLVKKTINIVQSAVTDAGLKKEQIEDIVLVGGSTRVPLVRSQIEEYFQKAPNVGMNPEEVVALGAAIQADILSGKNEEMVLLDVVPLSLGIETYGGTIGKIIHRNSKIPTMAQETFTTHVDGQRNVLIHVLQGERELAKDCRSLARFDLRGLPPMPAGLPKIQVTFLVDANGILKVRAKELATHLETTVEVKPSYGLTDEQVEKMLSDSFAFAEKDMKNRQLIDTKVQAEGVLRSAEKILKDAKSLGIDEKETKPVREKIQKIRTFIAGTDYIAIRTELDSLEEIARPVAEKVMSETLRRSTWD